MIKELEHKKKEKKIEEDLKKDDSLKEDESPKLNSNKQNQKETNNNNNKAKKTGVDSTKGNQLRNKSKGKGNIEKILNIKKNASNNSKQFSNTTKK